MTQDDAAGKHMRVVTICGWIVVGLAAATLQGLAVFWFQDFGGPFLAPEH